MRKLSLVLILLFALANADPQFTIKGAKNVHCDPTGKGRFDLTISSESTMPTLQFGLTLKPEEGDSITATCYMGDIPTDLASSTDNLSGESDSDSLSDTAFVSDQTDSMEVSSDSDSTRIRLLQSISSDNIAVCIYEPPEEEGEYTLDSTDNAEIGVEKDLVEAAKWYRAAAEQGSAEAQSALGACYAFGDGVEKDPKSNSKFLQ